MFGHIIYCLSFQMTYILYLGLKREELAPCSSPEICNFYSLFLLGSGAYPNLGKICTCI